MYNSQIAKVTVLRYLLYDAGFRFAVTEGLNYSDVLGVKRSMLTSEYEVKVSRGDLMQEIKTIRAVLTGDVTNLKLAHTKFLKHDHYLRDRYHSFKFKPNYFYFAVPLELKDVALAGVEGTPYGVLVVRYGYNANVDNMFHVCYVAKIAKRMHKNPIGTDDLSVMMRRASLENLTLRLNALIEKPNKSV